MATLKLNSGDDITVKFTITDVDEAAIDITGGTIRLKIAKNLNVANGSAEYFGSYTGFTDATNGIHDEVIPDSTTATWTPGSYKYQIRFIDSAGNVVSETVDNCLIEKNLIDDE